MKRGLWAWMLWTGLAAVAATAPQNQDATGGRKAPPSITGAGAFPVHERLACAWLYEDTSAGQRRPVLMVFYHGAAGWQDGKWQSHFDAGHGPAAEHVLEKGALALTIKTDSDGTATVQGQVVDLATANVYLVCIGDGASPEAGAPIPWERADFERLGTAPPFELVRTDPRAGQLLDDHLVDRCCAGRCPESDAPVPGLLDPFAALREAAPAQLVIMKEIDRGGPGMPAVLLEGEEVAKLLAPAAARPVGPESACGRFIRGLLLKDGKAAGEFRWSDDCTELETPAGVFELTGELRKRFEKWNAALRGKDADRVFTAACPFEQQRASCAWLPEGTRALCLPDENGFGRLPLLRVTRTWTLPRSAKPAGERIADEMAFAEDLEQEMQVHMESLCYKSHCADYDSGNHSMGFGEVFVVIMAGAARYETVEARDAAAAMARETGFEVTETENPPSRWNLFVRHADVPAVLQALQAASCPAQE